jgi:hypothetical protein
VQLLGIGIPVQLLGIGIPVQLLGIGISCAAVRDRNFLCSC